jgi:hypothetical protein
VRVAGVAGALVTERPRSGLPVVPIARPHADAVVLERRERAAAVAARRAGRGRVLQAGYDETWRWRMAGGDDAPDAHRAWWSRAVAAVAHAPAAERPVAVLPDEAPVAALHAALGPPAAVEEASSGAIPRRPEAWLFALALASLVAEWTSRRLRGAR